MSMMNESTSETSVTFSLAELAKIEEERVRDEDRKRSLAREREARERREAEARRRATEAAEVAAQAEARALRLREEAVEKARLEARERVEADVARIEAEAKARLEAENANRAHELAMLRVRTEGANRSRVRMLAVAVGLLLCSGGAAAYEVKGRVSGLEQDAAQLREQQASLAKEREHRRETELVALERRYASLRARPLAGGAEDARATVEAARNAIDARALDNDRLRSFGEAIDALETRIDALEKLAALDHRYADLSAWAGERRRTEVMAAARSAGARAKATGTDAALSAYEAALNQLRDTLAQSAGGSGRQQQHDQHEGPKGTCAAGDPGCDLDGHRLF